MPVTSLYNKDWSIDRHTINADPLATLIHRTMTSIQYTDLQNSGSQDTSLPYLGPGARAL